MAGNYKIILKGFYSSFSENFERVLKFDLLLNYQKDQEDAHNITYTFRNLAKIDASNLLSHIIMTYDNLDFMEIKIE